MGMGNAIDETTLLLTDSQGISLAQALHKVQSQKFYKGKKSDSWHLKDAEAAVEQSRADISKIRAYVELHVEQAGFLEEAGIPIGIVSGAAMPTRWSIEFIGEQAHSGATPMDRRKNALVAASEFVLLVDQLAKQEAAHGTVGAITKMTVEPNAMNTVPGKCTLFMDLRSTDKESKDKVKAVLLEKLSEICTRHQVTHNRKILSEDDPKTFSPNIMALSEKICQSMDVPYMVLPSRAGHDACNVSNRVKEVGMIFVPSKGGVSHHHAEWTDIDDIVLGTKILLLTLFELATT
jgi:hydantoinase/carbamoylase family amidase